MKNIIALSIFIFGLFFISCDKETPLPDPQPEPANTGSIVFKFAHKVDGNTVELDTMKYTNTAGNKYKITDFKYFISDVILHKSDGTDYTINKVTDKHYVDNVISSTMTWNVSDPIPEGSYDSISFTFGIIKSKNISNMFVNPPEIFMAWPEPLGGGYHYLMMNGKWQKSVDTISNFNFHIGIGQTYDGLGNIIGFIDNAFNVKLPSSAFSIAKNQTKEIQIIMNIDSWFNSPIIWDFNIQGENIMQNQASMSNACKNGADAFTIGYIN
jgi:hypothetical protein